VEKVRFDGTGIVGLFGMGGSARTVLALKMREELTPRYPDAQFYLDLKGTGKQALSPVEVDDAHNPCVRTRHLSPLIVADLEGKYRSVLNERRAILFLDNTAGREQIQNVIPPEGVFF